jgi:5'-phosphate synthase pdxT subunit
VTTGPRPTRVARDVPNERLRGPRRVGVLALQGDFREHLAALRACEVEGVPIRLASELVGVDALILPGGESTTMAHLMEPALRQSIQQRAAAGMPVLGTCAGMILMARAISDGRPDQEPLKLMDIVVRRNAYGRQIDSFEAEVESPAIGGAGPAVFIRAPQLTERAADVAELARHRDQPVAVKQGNRLALAFHPELTPDRRWHQYFLTLNGEKR